MDDVNSTLIPSSNSSSHPQCFGYRVSELMFSGFVILNALLVLPLNAWVLWLATRPAPPATTKPLMALLTSNMAALELCYGLVCVLLEFFLLLPEAGPLLNAALAGNALMLGRPLFHCSHCVERYLAVLHPLGYLRLRASRYRGLYPALVWLLILGNLGVAIAYAPQIPLEVTLAEFLLCTLVMCFCSLAVLKALVRPGPGDRGGAGGGAGAGGGRSELKRRAFQTMVLILGAVLVSFGAFLAGLPMMMAGAHYEACVAMASGYFFAVPSSLVQPLLFLHSAGKLPRLRQRSGRHDP